MALPQKPLTLMMSDRPVYSIQFLESGLLKFPSLAIKCLLERPKLFATQYSVSCKVEGALKLRTLRATRLLHSIAAV
jgi:hypothetical protein